MTSSWKLFKAVRMANAVLFLVAVGVGFDHSMASALTRLTGAPHWSTAVGPVVVEDRTGQPRWHRATRHAVDVWNAAAAPTGLRLTWTAGPTAAPGEPCGPEPGRVVVCTTSWVALDDSAPLNRQGVARVELGDDRAQTHIGRATVLVCDDCRIGAARRLVVAAHELGHALGLLHSTRPASVMFHTGGPDAPDPGDVADLRALYAHADGPDHCGYFDVRAGPLCF